MDDTWHEGKLQKGDLIRCRDKADIIITDLALNEAGYVTEYVYRINHEEGLWIEIRGRRKDGKDNAV